MTFLDKMVLDGAELRIWRFSDKVIAVMVETKTKTHHGTGNTIEAAIRAAAPELAGPPPPPLPDYWVCDCGNQFERKTGLRTFSRDAHHECETKMPEDILKTRARRMLRLLAHRLDVVLE